MKGHYRIEKVWFEDCYWFALKKRTAFFWLLNFKVATPEELQAKRNPAYTYIIP